MIQRHLFLRYPQPVTGADFANMILVPLLKSDYHERCPCCHQIAPVPEDIRFWSRVTISQERFYLGTPCWNWNKVGFGGYGQFTIGMLGKKMPAHRWAYEYCVGPMKVGMDLHHMCQNKLCVNPTHLQEVAPFVHKFLGGGSPAENSMKLYCVRGHPMYVEHLYFDSQGYRHCKFCVRAANKEAKKRYKLKKRLSRYAKNPIHF